jgi:hypothetical protein
LPAMQCRKRSGDADPLAKRAACYFRPRILVTTLLLTDILLYYDT